MIHVIRRPLVQIPHGTVEREAFGNLMRAERALDPTADERLPSKALWTRWDHFETYGWLIMIPQGGLSQSCGALMGPSRSLLGVASPRTQVGMQAT